MHCGHYYQPNAWGINWTIFTELVSINLPSNQNPINLIRRVNGHFIFILTSATSQQPSHTTHNIIIISESHPWKQMKIKRCVWNEFKFLSFRLLSVGSSDGHDYQFGRSFSEQMYNTFFFDRMKNREKKVADSAGLFIYQHSVLFVNQPWKYVFI